MMNEEPNNIGNLLEQQKAKAPGKVFLFSDPDGRQFTYAEFDAAVNRAAALLAAHGVAKGDVVSLLMPNSAEYIIAYFACWKLGALAGPVNSLLKEHEIEFVMNNSEAKAILVHSEFTPRIENIRGHLTHLKSVIEFDDEAEATPILVILVDDEANPRVTADVHEALQHVGFNTFGLLVHRRIESRSVVRVTDWNDMRAAGSVNCGHPGHAAGLDKILDSFREFHGASPTCGAA